MLYTGQIRYSGQDRLDITVKGNCPAGRLYAPTWDIVMGHKNGTVSDDGYREKYYALLIERWYTHADEMMKLVEIASTRDITVVCYCKPGKFCHRYLLARFLRHNWGTLYGGER